MCHAARGLLMSLTGWRRTGISSVSRSVRTAPSLLFFVCGPLCGYADRRDIGFTQTGIFNRATSLWTEPESAEIIDSSGATEPAHEALRVEGEDGSGEVYDAEIDL